MVQALQERASALDGQIRQLQAQKQVVLDHQAWLEKRRHRQPPRTTPGTWPRVRPRATARSDLSIPSPQKTP